MKIVGLGITSPLILGLMTRAFVGYSNSRDLFLIKQRAENLGDIRPVGLFRNAPMTLLLDGRDEKVSPLFAVLPICRDRIESWLCRASDNKNPGDDDEANEWDDGRENEAAKIGDSENDAQ